MDGVYCSINALATEILRFSYHFHGFQQSVTFGGEKVTEVLPLLHSCHSFFNPKSTQKALVSVDKTSKNQNSQELHLTWKYSYSIFFFPLVSLNILDTLHFLCTKTGYELEVNSLLALQCIIHEVSSCFMVITRFGMPQLWRKHPITLLGWIFLQLWRYALLS